jgi:hypothetical protein
MHRDQAANVKLSSASSLEPRAEIEDELKTAGERKQYRCDVVL